MRKKIMLTIAVIILLILDSYLFFNFIFLRFKNIKSLEKNDVFLAEKLDSSNFKIDKIALYTSVSGINKNKNFQKDNWILDIFQYADIAIYFSKPEKLTPYNTIENLSISNPTFKVSKDNFEPALYYTDSNTFGTDKILNNYKIDEKLDFNVVNFDNSDNLTMYNTPIFFSDLSNPITLKFVNILSKKCEIPNTEKIIFDGSLLSKTDLKFKDLNSSLSFNIDVKNFAGELYSTNITLQIPIENDKTTLLKSGSIYEIKNLDLSLIQKAQ